MDHARQRRIRTVSHIMAVLCMAVMATLLLLLIVFWSQEDPHGFSQRTGLVVSNAIDPAGSAAGLNVLQRVLAFAVAMIPAGTIMWGLWKLKQLFTAFGKCQFYTASTIGYMKGFALALVASSVLQTVIHPAIALITSMESPDGLRIGIGISSAQLTQASLGVLLLVIAWVMDEGREIVEENRQFV